MVTEKINDFVDVWAQTIGLNNKDVIAIVKNDIIGRYNLYVKMYPTISINDDPCLAYIIKPINGKYNLEDFLLNRLMLGLRSVDIISSLEGNSADYSCYHKTLSGDFKTMSKKIDEKSLRHPKLKQMKSRIIIKTLEHELGHCLKTKFSDGYKAPWGMGRKNDDIYHNLISNLIHYKNGKYASQIKKVSELSDKEENTDNIKTGIKDSEKRYGYHTDFTYLDEVLNEAEALVLTKSDNIEQETHPLIDSTGRISSTGNKVKIYNYMSGYRSFTNYGFMLKILIGRKDMFFAEYISSEQIFQKFENEYSDIIKEFCIIDSKHYSAIEYLFILFGYLLRTRKFNEDIILELDHFFAKCYSKKINNIINENNGQLDKNKCNAILNQIEYIRTKLTTNDDIQKRNLLPHIVILNQLEQKIRSLNINISLGSREISNSGYSR